jgi:D-amino-acid dehydrogenase
VVGEGASFGNAGNISPGAVVPYLIPAYCARRGWLLNPGGHWRCGQAIFCGSAVADVRGGTAHESCTQDSRAMRALHGGTLEAHDTLAGTAEA